MDEIDHSHQSLDQDLELWKQGNLETLDMIGEGDFLGIKYDAPMSLGERKKERRKEKKNLANFNE